MDAFVEQLASLCRQHVTRNKWVFVPSHALGHTLGERIALNGTNWLNLRFVTPLDVALRMGAPFLVERGIEPSEEGLGPALIMRLMLDLPREGGYFRPLADQSTLAEALWSTIRELRMAGLKSVDLRADAFASPAKHTELRALLASYEAFLASNNRGDMALVYEEALQHLDWCPIQQKDCWTELPDVVWSPLQRRLMDVMAGERIAPSALSIPGVSVPRRMSSLQASRITPDAAVSPLAFLVAPEADREPRTAAREQRSESVSERVALFHAGGREAEVEEVFRRILATGAALDQVEIACASDEHVSVIWEKALRHEWPVTLAPGISAARTRPGRAVLELCDWIETDFAASHLRHLLQSGDMGLEVEDEGFTAGQAARILARAEAGWGRASYGLALGRLRRSYESRAADKDASDDDRRYAHERAQLVARVEDWITRLVESIPEPDADRLVSLQPIVECALQYTRRSTARHSQLDHRVGAALEDHIDELRALGAFRCSLEEALRFIRERVQGLQVAQERPRPGHLHVSTLVQAGYAGRPHLFVVGLEEGRVFPATSEDPVLLDAERAAISLDLRLSIDRVEEAVHAVLGRLATWRGQAWPAQPENGEVANARPTVTFSYSLRDTREFRETYASWLMLQAFRLQRGDASLSYRDMKTALGEPASCVPHERGAAVAESGWWTRTVLGCGEPGAVAVESTFGAMSRGRVAAARRATEEFTEFDGYVPRAGTVLDPCGGGAFSVTELEAAAGCPFRFFLKRGLGVRPVDERERDKDVWLDPLTRGSALHDIYAAALRRCHEERRRPTESRDREWLLDLARTALEDLRHEMPPASDEVYERESRDFIGDVELFLHEESRSSAHQPVGLEVSFGRPLADAEDPLARVEPVEIDLGKGLKFRVAGRIDRIDQVTTGEFEVLDYKTGTYWRESWAGTFSGGRKLQHALYGLAATELLKTLHTKPQVRGGVYYFSSRRGRGKRVSIPAPTRAVLRQVLSDLRDLIVSGAFIASSNKEDCKFCDYKAACVSAANDQAAAKLESRLLEPYRRLAAHA